MKMHLFAVALVAALAPVQAQEKKATINVGPAAKAVLDAKEISADQAEKLIASTPNLIILDVRTPEEYEHEHIKGAVNLNVFDVEFAKSAAALDQSKPVLIHCQSGRRSRQALKTLSGKVSFTQVYHLTDGFVGWKKAGKPIETNPLPSQKKKASDK